MPRPCERPPSARRGVGEAAENALSSSASPAVAPESTRWRCREVRENARRAPTTSPCCTRVGESDGSPRSHHRRDLSTPAENEVTSGSVSVPTRQQPSVGSIKPQRVDERHQLRARAAELAPPRSPSAADAHRAARRPSPGRPSCAPCRPRSVSSVSASAAGRALELVASRHPDAGAKGRGPPPSFSAITIREHDPPGIGRARGIAKAPECITRPRTGTCKASLRSHDDTWIVALSKRRTGSVNAPACCSAPLFRLCSMLSSKSVSTSTLKT